MIRSILRPIAHWGTKNTGNGWPGGWPGGWRSGPTRGERTPGLKPSGLGWPTKDGRAK